MSSKAVVQARNQQMRGAARMRASDDSALKKKIQETHAYDAREVEVEAILAIIKNILNLVSPGLNGFVNGGQKHEILTEETAALTGIDGIQDDVAFLLNKISCELSCKCSGGDANTSAMEILNVLSSYTWDAKAVMSLAAFTVNYGQFWLIANLFTTDPLAKSVAILKQLPDLLESSDMMKSRFETINNLVKVALEVTRRIVEFSHLPPKYITEDAEPMVIAMGSIPLAVYWMIRSLVACAAQVTEILNLTHRDTSLTAEAWELSSLVQRLSTMQEHLKMQLNLCHQYINEKKHKEYFQTLLHLFETTPHFDNQKILSHLIYSKELVVGTNKNTKVGVEVLRGKTVLFLISDLEISTDELGILETMHKLSRSRHEMQYDIVWLPLMDKVTLLKEEHGDHRFEELQSRMPWYTLQHPSLLEPAVARYIREMWHYSKKPIIVTLDPHGKVESMNAIHMIRIWGNKAYPFSSTKESDLWRNQKWELQLVVDAVDDLILRWMEEKAIICLYGGENEDWIRQFVTTTRAAADEAKVRVEMVYIGNATSKERTKRIIETVTTQRLGHCLSDLTLLWFFWTRIESMMHSKLQQGAKVPTPEQTGDYILAEVLNLLTYPGDNTEQGWALFSQRLGEGEDQIARAKGEAMMEAFSKYREWIDGERFVAALNEFLQGHHTGKHCNRLILPGVDDVPEMVVCTECHLPMEKFYMFRCCKD